MKNTTCKHLIGAIIIIVIIYALFEGSTTSFKFREALDSSSLKCCVDPDYGIYSLTGPTVDGDCKKAGDACGALFGPQYPPLGTCRVTCP